MLVFLRGGRTGGRERGREEGRTYLGRDLVFGGLVAARGDNGGVRLEP